ncbi:MAG: 50S ribosomal protein L3 [Verrucomicrobia bacterium]|nr:MAG: 50S ribosomal protein L3 [Verrucomicrobiota bacterium]
MSTGLLGKKKEMTRVYDDNGRLISVTIIEVSKNRVLQLKTAEKDGYRAVQVGFDDQKPQRCNKAQLGHFSKSGSSPKKFIREFRLKEQETAPEMGDLPITNFEVGQFVDVIGHSKGKGFQGVVKRHGFAGQPASHGSMMHRRTGAIGNRSTPGRVWKNVGMPGHMGNERVTVQNLQIVQVREEDQVILVSGSVPGPKNSYLIVRPSKKKAGQKATSKGQSVRQGPSAAGKK